MLLKKQMNSLPEHIAIMMDGNGRWATKRGLPRTAGHFAGMKTMRKMIRICNDLKIKYLTLYAFSSENWTRPQEEVHSILSLPKKFLDERTLEEFDRHHIKIKFIGDLSRFSAELRHSISNVEERTRNHDGMIVTFALNYGGRMEVIAAVKKMIEEGIDISELDEERFENYLFTKGLPAPELIIRTSGEQRLSNFLLWQSSQAELWFTDTLWPDFDLELLLKAIDEFNERKKIRY